MRESLRRAKYSGHATDEVAVRQAVAHAYQPSPKMAGVQVRLGLRSEIHIPCRRHLTTSAIQKRDRFVKFGKRRYSRQHACVEMTCQELRHRRGIGKHSTEWLLRSNHRSQDNHGVFSSIRQTAFTGSNGPKVGATKPSWHQAMEMGVKCKRM